MRNASATNSRDPVAWAGGVRAEGCRARASATVLTGAPFGMHRVSDRHVVPSQGSVPMIRSLRSLDRGQSLADGRPRVGDGHPAIPAEIESA